MTLGMLVGLGLGHILSDGNLAPRPPKGHSNQFWPQIKKPLGMDIGLGPGDFVLDGDLAPPKGHSRPPNFRPMSIVAKRLEGSRCHLVRR